MPREPRREEGRDRESWGEGCSRAVGSPGEGCAGAPGTRDAPRAPAGGMQRGGRGGGGCGSLRPLPLGFSGVGLAGDSPRSAKGTARRDAPGLRINPSASVQPDPKSGESPMSRDSQQKWERLSKGIPATGTAWLGEPKPNTSCCFRVPTLALPALVHLGRSRESR